MTVRTHGDLIVLPHWEIRPPAPPTWYRTQAQYPDTKQTGLCPILTMLSAKLGSDKYLFFKLLVWLDHSLNPCISPKWETGAQLIQSKSYQGGYWLVTVHTHVCFIVLPHCVGHWFDSTISFFFFWFPVFLHGKPALYWFGHCVWSRVLKCGSCYAYVFSVELHWWINSVAM